MLSYFYLYNSTECGAVFCRVYIKIRLSVLQLLCEMLRCTAALERKEATEMTGGSFGCPQVTSSQEINFLREACSRMETLSELERA